MAFQKTELFLTPGALSDLFPRSSLVLILVWSEDLLYQTSQELVLDSTLALNQNL